MFSGLRRLRYFHSTFSRFSAWLICFWGHEPRSRAQPRDARRFLHDETGRHDRRAWFRAWFAGAVRRFDEWPTLQPRCDTRRPPRLSVGPGRLVGASPRGSWVKSSAGGPLVSAASGLQNWRARRVFAALHLHPNGAFQHVNECMCIMPMNRIRSAGRIHDGDHQGFLTGTFRKILRHEWCDLGVLQAGRPR